MRSPGATLVGYCKVGIKRASMRYKNVERTKFSVCPVISAQRRRVIFEQDRLTASSDGRSSSAILIFQDTEETTTDRRSFCHGAQRTKRIEARR